MAAILPYLPAIIGAVTSGASALAGGNKETPMQRKQRELIDQILASLGGNGPYSDLFEADFDTFQKSFVDPAKAMFSNQIAPQIQQQYIARGQQRGTGLDDTLTRAGVDLDQMLNQQFMQFQQQAQQNKLGGINSILNAGAGAEAEQSPWEKFFGGLSGFGTSSAFPQLINQARQGFTS